MHSAVLEDRQQPILTTNRAADELKQKYRRSSFSLTFLARRQLRFDTLHSHHCSDRRPFRLT